MRRAFTLLALILFAAIFVRLIGAYSEMQELRPLAQAYATMVPADLNVPNIVTGILITYRGFDTLGEVAVLFMVAASIGLLLTKKDGAAEGADDKPLRPPGEIVLTGTDVLLPIIFTFGAYVIVNGHLSAGGGFQGGAIVASGAMLMLLARPRATFNVKALSIIESLAGVFYVLLGVLGLVLAGGFLDPRFMPAGEFGAFVSAGAVPVISALLGIKVGAELSVIIDRFRS
ncbi:MAG: sodium:proton antiporter [Afipia sp.]|nr:sodium:proton antiporter [Afipia sp.]